MTTQESFKKRVRARMARTGERYTTARRALQAKAADSTRSWVSDPEMGDEAIANGTGHRWDHWCDLIDSWGVEEWDHASVANRIEAEHPVNGWWAQCITVGYERITGLRLPNQMADGTFTANKSKTVRADGIKLRELLLDDDHRDDLFPDQPTELRSRPTAKAVRLGLDPGVATIELGELADGRTKVVVQHTKLPTVDEVERWKFWWAEWLDALDEAGGG